MDALEREPEVKAALEQLTELLAAHETIRSFKRIKEKIEKISICKSWKKKLKPHKKRPSILLIMENQKQKKLLLLRQIATQQSLRNSR